MQTQTNTASKAGDGVEITPEMIASGTLYGAEAGAAPAKIEISVDMSQAGGRAVAAFMADPLVTAGVDWEAVLAARVYRAMRPLDGGPWH
jgi:hypothetical protein